MTVGSPERGSGLLSTSFGVGAFLLLLLFGAHVLLNLWAASSVGQAAHLAAEEVARGSVWNDAAETRAIGRARDGLGTYGNRLSFQVGGRGTDEVVVEVEGPGISLLPDALAGTVGLDRIHRRVVMRREEPR